MRPSAFDTTVTPEIRGQARRIARTLVIGYATIAAGLAAIAIERAAATETRPTLAACAARDLRLVTLIEQQGEQQTIGAGQLAHAYFTMMDARNACRDGRIAEALRIYDSILLAPTLLSRTQ